MAKISRIFRRELISRCLFCITNNRGNLCSLKMILCLCILISVAKCKKTNISTFEKNCNDVLNAFQNYK